ncbi:MAG: CmcJ/NvfI family oxidoreductase [Sphingomonas fennica]
MTIENGRLAAEPFTLDTHGFCLARVPSAVADFTDADAVARDYAPEVGRIVRELTGAGLVVPMGAQVRSSGATGKTVQPPAAEAHVDFTGRSARMLAERLYPAGRPGWTRFLAFSLWRTFSPAPQDWPLALADFRTVKEEDGVPNVKVDVDAIPEGDALFADIPGEDQMMAATIFRHDPAHRWYYFPDMDRDELILIKFHDSDHARAWRAPHTAFRDPTRPDAVTRESIEFRGMAFWE